VALDAELDEMLKRAREPPVFLRFAAVMRHLDFKPGHCAVSRQGKDAVGRAFEHFDQAPRERALDRTSLPRVLSHHAAFRLA
jgi:hypothetical protein